MVTFPFSHRGVLRRDPAAAPTLWGWAACLMLCVGCESGDSAQKEQKRIVRSIHGLQMADSYEKAAWLARLRSLPCSAATACHARDTCVEAYEALLRSRKATRNAQVELPGDTQKAAAHTLTAEDALATFAKGRKHCERARHALQWQGR